MDNVPTSWLVELPKRKIEFWGTLTEVFEMLDEEEIRAGKLRNLTVNNHHRISYGKNAGYSLKADY